MGFEFIVNHSVWKTSISCQTILKTTFTELTSILNFRIILKADFMGRKQEIQLGKPPKEVFEPCPQRTSFWWLFFMWVSLCVLLSCKMYGYQPSYWLMSKDCCTVNLQGKHFLLESASIASSNKANNTQACCKNASQFVVPRILSKEIHMLPKRTEGFCLTSEIFTKSFELPKSMNHFESCSGICHCPFRGASPEICPGPSINLCEECSKVHVKII